MIMLTTVKGNKFCLNSDLIYKVDQAHDSIITFTCGKTLRVKEKPEEIIKKVIEYKREIHSKLPGVQE